jgi:hypothetical protein
MDDDQEENDASDNDQSTSDSVSESPKRAVPDVAFILAPIA